MASLVTVEHAARVLRKSPQTVRNRILAGDLDAVRVDGRLYVRLAEVQKLELRLREEEDRQLLARSIAPPMQPPPEPGDHLLGTTL